MGLHMEWLMSQCVARSSEDTFGFERKETVFHNPDPREESVTVVDYVTCKKSPKENKRCPGTVQTYVELMDPDNKAKSEAELMYASKFHHDQPSIDVFGRILFEWRTLNFVSLVGGDGDLRNLLQTLEAAHGST